MLAKIYIEAVLVDAGRADAIWQDWFDGRIKDSEAARLWARIAAGSADRQRAHGLASAPAQPQLRRRNS